MIDDVLCIILSIKYYIMNKKNEIMNILNYIIYNKKNNDYKKYLLKKVNYDILFFDPIEIKVMPRNIYIFTDNLSKDSKNNLLDFYIKLLYKIHKKINKKYKVKYYSSICNIISNKISKNPTIIRSNSIPYNKGYEIWIYLDMDSMDNIECNLEYYRIIICNSKEVEINITSVGLYL